VKTNPELQLLTFDYEAHAISFLSDGYMNLTEMCAAFKKRPLHFFQLPSTQRFIVALAADTGLGEGELMLVRKGGNQRRFTDDGKSVIGEVGNGDGNSVINQGTWAHPQIAMECARWLSPDFAIKCNRVVLGVMSGRVVHPAMDHEAIARIEAENRAKMRQVVASRYQLYGKWDVAGNVSVLAYSLTAKLPTDRATACRVGLLAKRHCLGNNRAAGLCRQSATDIKKRSLVATYPPESIHTAFMHLGYDHEAPTLERIEAVWKPMLPFYHRLKAIPLGLPSGG
jgi:hypothetical protein